MQPEQAASVGEDSYCPLDTVSVLIDLQGAARHLRSGPARVPCLPTSRPTLCPTTHVGHTDGPAQGFSSEVDEVRRVGNQRDAVADRGRTRPDGDTCDHQHHNLCPTHHDAVHAGGAVDLSPSPFPSLPCAADTVLPPWPPTIRAPFQALSFLARCEAPADGCSPTVVAAAQFCVLGVVGGQQRTLRREALGSTMKGRHRADRRTLEQVGSQRRLWDGEMHSGHREEAH